MFLFGVTCWGSKLNQTHLDLKRAYGLKLNRFLILIHFHCLTKFIKTMISIYLNISKEGIFEEGQGVFSHSSYNTKVSSHD